MSKRTSVTALTILIGLAVIFGFIFANKGDGPVMGLIISDRTITDMAGFEAAKSSPDNGVHLILEKEFNRFSEKYATNIPDGKDLYANIHFVECPKGSQYTVRWLSEGKTVKEEIKELTTDRQGIISYLLEGGSVKAGKYKLELYSEDQRIFEAEFTVE